MRKYSTYVVSSKDFNKEAIRICSDCFSSLKNNDYSVAPWVERDFWLCCRNSKFFELFYFELLSLLSVECQCPHEQRRPTVDEHREERKLTELTESILLTLTHISHVYKPQITSAVQEILNANLSSNPNVVVKEALTTASNILFKSSPTITEYINSIVDDYTVKVINNIIPLSCLIELIQNLRNEPTLHVTVFISFRFVLSQRESTRKSNIVVLHILRLILSIFPGIANNTLNSLNDELLSLLGCSNPISVTAANIGSIIKNEIMFMGSTYLGMVNDILRMTELLPAVPILYDSNFRFFPNLMYSSVPNQPLVKKVIELVHFLVRYTLKSTQILSNDDCVKFFKEIEISNDGIEKIKKKFGIVSDITEDEDPSNIVTPPIVPTQLIRFPINFEYTTELTQPFNDKELLFNFPTKTVYQSQITNYVTKFLEENADYTEFEQPVLICGNNLFLSTILQAQLLTSMKNENIVYYLLPHFGNERQASIASFLRLYDPIYERFAFHIISMASRIIPKLDENSSTYFVQIQDDVSLFENNLYFGDPSPAMMLQFSIQHFLLFAKNRVDIYVWKCDIEFSDNKKVVVPFITSLNIGPIFAARMTDGFKDEPIKMRVAKYSVCDNINVRRQIENKKFTSLALWNVENIAHIRPNDDALLLRITDKTSHLSKSKESLECPHEIIRELDFSLKNDELFRVLIDHRIYSNVKKITVTPMVSPTNPQRRMSMRFACFSPILQ